MDRFADGDASAFAEVFNAVAPGLRRYLRRLFGSSDGVDDLLNDVMLKVIAQRGQFIPGARVRPWIFRIAKNYFIDGTRRGRHVLETRGDLDEVQGNTMEHYTTSQYDELCARELGSIAQARLDTLAPAQRQVFELIVFDGLTHAEVAEFLAITVMSVKLRFHRARQALRIATASGNSSSGLDGEPDERPSP